MTPPEKIILVRQEFEEDQPTQIHCYEGKGEARLLYIHCIKTYCRQKRMFADIVIDNYTGDFQEDFLEVHMGSLVFPVRKIVVLRNAADHAAWVAKEQALL